MIFGKSRLELKVGIFVFVGLAILVTFALLIGDFKTWTSGYRINFMFNFVNGVKVGAPVRFAGVDIGEVKEMHFIIDPVGNTTKIEIVGWVKKAVNIPGDSTVWVNTLGLLGEKYVEIMPGKDYKNILIPNQTLVGTDPIPMQEITELAKNIGDHLDESLVKIINKQGTVGKLLYDDAIYNELEALIMDLRKHPWKLFWKTKEKK
jgi:phospholipid/cholesterol/gamma-HCH transport system substrate-binding protein